MIYKINHANIKDWAANYDGPLFDGILCDPPYHLVSMTKRWGNENVKNTPTMNTKEGGVFARSAKGFMGKDWDGVDENGIGIAQDPEMWRLLFNLLKPGAHLLAFSGSRTYHRMAVAIEDAGFEIRDMIEWVYGSGFPKSLNIGKAVDKIQGNEREITGNNGVNRTNGGMFTGENEGVRNYTKGTSEWEGYGTALKPAHEPCVLARKPIEGNVAQNCLKYGVGGLNIDGTRVGVENIQVNRHSGYNSNSLVESTKGKWKGESEQVTGRFPANLIHDNSDEVRECFPETKSGKMKSGVAKHSHWSDNSFDNNETYGDSGSAARFFYTAKASKSERNAGLDGFEGQITNDGRKTDIDNAFQRGITERKNHHPTVKPLALTKYLATLIKPPKGGRLLVPFSGSGSEMIGALQAGWEYVEGVELTKEYIPIAESRIKYWLEKEDKQGKII